MDVQGLHNYIQWNYYLQQVTKLQRAQEFNLFSELGLS
jgi:hypothetical protein